MGYHFINLNIIHVNHAKIILRSNKNTLKYSPFIIMEIMRNQDIREIRQVVGCLEEENDTLQASKML